MNIQEARSLAHSSVPEIQERLKDVRDRAVEAFKQTAEAISNIPQSTKRSAELIIALGSVFALVLASNPGQATMIEDVSAPNPKPNGGADKNPDLYLAADEADLIEAEAEEAKEVELNCDRVFDEPTLYTKNEVWITTAEYYGMGDDGNPEWHANFSRLSGNTETRYEDCNYNPQTGLPLDH